jgi:ABC-2 type transport system ATP-binding protein
VLLTTQYLDEADRLADRIAVIDRGRVIAEGSSDELKDQVGGERLDVTLEDSGQTEAAISALGELASERPTVVDGILQVPISARSGAIAEAVRKLDDGGVGIEDVARHRPTLDDVFLVLTGRAAEERDGEDGDSGEEGR